MKNSVSRGLLSLLLVFTLVTLAVSPFKLSTARAQGGACPLAPEDCALLAAATDAASNLHSVNVKSFNLDLAGGMGDQQSSLSVVGYGPIVFDEGNDTFAIDLTFSTATLTTPDQTQNGPGAFRLVDNAVYFGQGEGDAIKWQGTPLDSGDAQAQLDQLGLNLDDLRNFPIIEALQALNGLPGVVTWSRADDITLEDGRTVAVFNFDLSLAELVGSRDFVNALSEALLPLVGQLMGGSDGGGGSMFSDPSTISFLLSLVLSQLSDQLSTSTAQLSLWISPEDNLIYGLSSTIDVTVDLSFLTSMIPGSTGGDATSSSGPITFSLNFQSVLDQHNGEFTIEAPAEFDPLDTSSLNFDLSNILDSAGISLGGGDSAEPTAPTADTAEFDVAAGQETPGTLSDSNPNDLYRFQGTANSVVTITMRKTNESSNLDPYLKLYDGAGNLLAENDDATAVVEGLGFLDSQIAQFTIPADGTYVIEASALFIPDDGAYTLLVETN
ncbi:MAG: PPC domain-containing protein [Chloroflexi bacterium]|nr:PPC domain-containing protein [Chloroflexota bacterium]